MTKIKSNVEQKPKVEVHNVDEKVVSNIPESPIEDKGSVTDDFDKFNSETTNYELNKGTENIADQENKNAQTNSINTNDISNQAKLKMFLNFACLILAGFNKFLFDMLSGYKTDFKDMLLTTEEKETIEPYLNSPEILEWLQKLPVWIIGIAHVEYIFWNKHSEAVEKQKVKKNDTTDHNE